MHYAHSTDKRDYSDWQLLADHLRAVARLAEGFAATFGAGKAACLAGWLHDLGKYSSAFQAYIDGRWKGGRVDHSTAGAREVLKLAADLRGTCVAISMPIRHGSGSERGLGAFWRSLRHAGPRYL